MIKRKDFEEICNKVCREIKEGYILHICLENGYGYVKVVGPDDGDILPCDFGIGLSLPDQIKEALAYTEYHCKNKL